MGNLDNPRDWWNSIGSDAVKRELNDLRSNKQQAIRKAHFGKLGFIGW